MDSKEGKSIRPIRQPVAEYPDERRGIAVGTYVFPGQGPSHAFGSFPNPWEQIFKDTPVIRSRKSISPTCGTVLSSRDTKARRARYRGSNRRPYVARQWGVFSTGMTAVSRPS